MLYYNNFIITVIYSYIIIIFLGARRFPIEIKFLDDIAEDNLYNLPPSIYNKISQLISLTNMSNGDAKESIPLNMIKLQYTIIEALIKSYKQTGSAILVFVSGLFVFVII